MDIEYNHLIQIGLDIRECTPQSKREISNILRNEFL
jgi:hypothetical protein